MADALTVLLITEPCLTEAEARVLLGLPPPADSEDVEDLQPCLTE